MTTRWLKAGALAALLAGCGGETAGTDTSATTARTDAAVPDAGFCWNSGGACVIGGTKCGVPVPALDCEGDAFCCTDPPTECTEANMEPIRASDYNRSCTVDADCVAVGEGNFCLGCLKSCPSAAISAGAMAAYLSDVARTTAGRYAPGSPLCFCPAWASPLACCRDGVCQPGASCEGSGQ